MRNERKWAWLAVDNEAGERLGLAQHRIMAGVELVPPALQGLAGAALMGERRIGALAAPHDRRLPRQAPETLELHRLGQGRHRMRRAALEGPFARRRLEVGE